MSSTNRLASLPVLHEKAKPVGAAIFIIGGLAALTAIVITHNKKTP